MKPVHFEQSGAGSDEDPPSPQSLRVHRCHHHWLIMAPPQAAAITGTWIDATLQLTFSLSTVSSELRRTPEVGGGVLNWQLQQTSKTPQGLGFCRSGNASASALEKARGLKPAGDRNQSVMMKIPSGIMPVEFQGSSAFSKSRLQRLSSVTLNVTVVTIRRVLVLPYPASVRTTGKFKTPSQSLCQLKPARAATDYAMARRYSVLG